MLKKFKTYKWNERMPAARVRELLDLYKNGTPIKTLAEIFKRSRSGIIHQLHKYNVYSYKRDWHRMKRKHYLPKQEILNAVRFERLSLSKIASRHECSVQTLARNLERWGEAVLDGRTTRHLNSTKTWRGKCSSCGLLIKSTYSCEVCAPYKLSTPVK